MMLIMPLSPLTMQLFNSTFNIFMLAIFIIQALVLKIIDEYTTTTATFKWVISNHTQLVREVQYGIVCLFKSVPPEMMSNNQLLRKSNHCKSSSTGFTTFFVEGPNLKL